MSNGAGNRIPKTLADVSHLFFSNVEERAQTAPTTETAVPVARERSSLPEPIGAPGGTLGRVRPRHTRAIVVTGGEDSPGKSTTAVNLAQALLPWGRVALLDADPRIPNARFYLGFPSWSYLWPVMGGGREAPATLTDSGLIVVDWTSVKEDAAAAWGDDDAVHVDLADVGRQRLDYAVIDVPSDRIASLGGIAGRVWRTAVVAAPGWTGFQSAFAVAARLVRDLGAGVIDLVVNRAPDEQYAGAYCEKFSSAVRELLSVEARLLAGVGECPGIGSEQRERGPIVRSRPDAAVALAFRNAAATLAASQAMAHSGPGSEPGGRMESTREDEGPEVGAS